MRRAATQWVRHAGAIVMLFAAAPVITSVGLYLFGAGAGGSTDASNAPAIPSPPAAND